MTHENTYREDISPICKYVGQVFKNCQEKKEEKNNLAQSIPLILYPLVHRTHFTFYAKNSAFSTFLPKKDGVDKISFSEVPPFASYTPAAVYRQDQSEIPLPSDGFFFPTCWSRGRKKSCRTAEESRTNDDRRLQNHK